jgi:hypothetical protein
MPGCLNVSLIFRTAAQRQMRGRNQRAQSIDIERAGCLGHALSKNAAQLMTRAEWVKRTYPYQGRNWNEHRRARPQGLRKRMRRSSSSAEGAPFRQSEDALSVQCRLNRWFVGMVIDYSMKTSAS